MFRHESKMARRVIDYGVKSPELSEYWPRFVLSENESVLISIDIGLKNYAVYVEGNERCLYAGLWVLGEKQKFAEMQRRLTTLFERIAEFFQRATHVLVEQQLAHNIVQILRLEQHTLSYLELRHPHLTAVGIQSTLKYKMLDGPMGTQKHRRKTWAVTKACELLGQRGDPVVTFIRSLNKADDVSDAYIQAVAWRLKSRR